MTLGEVQRKAIERHVDYLAVFGLMNFRINGRGVIIVYENIPTVENPIMSDYKLRYVSQGYPPNLKDHVRDYDPETQFVIFMMNPDHKSGIGYRIAHPEGSIAEVFKKNKHLNWTFPTE